MWRAYLAKTAKLAYNERNEHGKWRLAIGWQAQAFMINTIGISFILCVK
jgi:hypothetical protein